eukprot:15444822-Alexandrium_andersonii.AAC.1
MCGGRDTHFPAQRPGEPGGEQSDEEEREDKLVPGEGEGATESPARTNAESVCGARHPLPCAAAPRSGPRRRRPRRR